MKSNLFKDILKTKTEGNGMKFSQGRVYLFVFVVCYIASLAYFMFFPNKDSMSETTDAIQWAILLFATYVFGGKGVTATKDIFSTIKGKTTNGTQTTQTSSTSTTTTGNIPPGKKEEDMCT